jgi:crotonobetainyl-CoA:carnitine CoA-transferase CaiB-like acyl-CoA transferase
MKSPLEGIRVLDLSRFQVGPACSMMLSDMGAEVIKVEPPGKGETTRHSERFEKEYLLNGENLCFLALNRNKRSVTVDIKQEKGKEVIYRLARVCDVFLENFRPGVADALGVGYQKLSEINPRIIYCSASCYGQEGPYAHKPGMDTMAQAMGGIMSVTGGPDSPPTPVGAAIADQVGGMNCAYGIVLALFHRERTGEGRRVEVSLLDSQMALQSWEMMAALNLDLEKIKPRKGHYLSHTGIYRRVICGVYKTRDSYMVADSFTEKRWPGICRALGMEHLENDPRFDTVEKRQENQEELNEMVEKIFLTRTTNEWIEILEKEDILASPVYTYKEVFSDPHVLAGDMIVEQEHPVAGKFKLLGSPVKLSQLECGPRSPAPMLGQDNEEVLNELGYSREEVEQLREEGVV